MTSRKINPGIWFILPTMLLLATLIIYPMLSTVQLSITDANGAFAGMEFQPGDQCPLDQPDPVQHGLLRHRLGGPPAFARHSRRYPAEPAICRPVRGSLSHAHSVGGAGHRRRDDLGMDVPYGLRHHQLPVDAGRDHLPTHGLAYQSRSEERRVGKEGVSTFR